MQFCEKDFLLRTQLKKKELLETAKKEKQKLIAALKARFPKGKRDGCKNPYQNSDYHKERSTTKFVEGRFVPDCDLKINVERNK